MALQVAIGDIPEACAVEVAIEAVEDDLVNLSETLSFDGTDVATFGDITPVIDGIGRGDRVLFGSSAFQVWADYDVDALLSDEDCVRLEPGVSLGFRGSFGNDAGSLTLPAGIGMHTAYDGTELPTSRPTASGCAPWTEAWISAWAGAAGARRAVRRLWPSGCSGSWSWLEGGAEGRRTPEALTRARGQAVARQRHRCRAPPGRARSRVVGDALR